MKAGRLVLTALGLLAAASAPLAGVEDFFIRVELSVGSTGAMLAVSPAPVVAITPRGTMVGPERPGDEATRGAGDLAGDLADVYRLREVYSLAESTFSWDGTTARLPGLFMLERGVFKLELDPRSAGPDRMKLRIQLSRIRNRAGDLERLLDTDLVATLDDPLVVGFAYRGQSLFLTIEVSRTRPGEGAPGAGGGQDRSRGSAVAPVPVRRVEPKLPEGVDLDSLNGEVVLRVSVDADGRVKEVEVLKSLQPEVDRETVKALKEWTFEPAPEKGGRGGTTFVMTFRFGTPRWDPAEAEEPSATAGAPGTKRPKTKKSGLS
jgi:TonB family protein